MNATATALVETFDALMPGWETDEARANGEILSERDFPLAEVEDVSDADWAVFTEVMFNDHRFDG